MYIVVPDQRAGPNPVAEIRGRFPISRRYEIKYPDGSKKHISRQERDDLVLSGFAKESGSGTYVYLGQLKTYSSFVDYGRDYIATPRPTEPIKRFHPGQFIFEHDGKRHTERLETPEAYAARLNLYEASQ